MKIEIPHQSLWEAAKGVFGLIVKEREETSGATNVFTIWTEMMAPEV